MAVLFRIEEIQRSDLGQLHEFVLLKLGNAKDKIVDRSERLLVARADDSAPCCLVQTANVAQADAQGERSPLLDRRGGRDIKRNIAKRPLKERTGWWFKINRNVFDLEPPPRLRRFGCFAPFSYGRSHPSWPGGAIQILQRAFPVRARHIDWPRLQSMPLRILDQCRGAIETHGLVVQYRGGEGRKIMTLQVRACIRDQRKACGMRLRKPVKCEGRD